MTCDEYLSMLSTLPVSELSGGRAHEHAAGCRDCHRVTRVVAERERSMLTAFDDLRPRIPAADTAASALTLSRRRKVLLYNRLGLAIATVAPLLYFVLSRVVPAPIPSMVSERFRLQCLSPEQAAEVLRPHVQATGRISFRPSSPLGVITVTASPEEMTTARSVLTRYDNSAQSQCAVQVTVPREP